MSRKHPKTRVRVKRIANRLKRENPTMKRSFAHAIARGRVKKQRRKAAAPKANHE